MDLKTLPENEFEALAKSIADERARRWQEKAAALRKARENRAILIRQCLEASDAFINIVAPNHSLLSCSDEACENGYEYNGHIRCIRCYLLDVLTQRERPSLEYLEVDFQLRLADS